ncbi:MAG: DUF411 domain-containing protein [Zoogloeaceae bacterium]|jgi:hypothetical protein|nr:DUF411 domain-containing protein [Zoogloeaceae bacterium]
MKRVFWLLALLFVAPVLLADAGLPAVTMYKNPACGCCGAWTEHMRNAGFDRLQSHAVTDMSATRRALGMPEAHASCHTAQIGQYLLEGHVPADDIKRLLREHPDAIGLAVPGMPMGSPGMEGGKAEAYDTLLILKDGSARLFQRHDKPMTSHTEKPRIFLIPDP